jgi:Ca2+-binding RTX toxin-like protein
MATYYVDDNNPATIGTGDGTIGNPFKTVQLALNAAAATGDTIQVAAGIYNETLVITKSVTMLGANSGVDGAGVRGAETVITSAGDMTIEIEANNVTVDGFTLLNSAGWAVIGNDSHTPTGSVITNNVINTSVSDAYGVVFYNYPTPTPTFSTISHNHISGGEIAVLLYNNGYASVTENTITDTNRGVQTGNFHLPTPSGTPEISNNDISAHIVGIYHNLFYGTATAFEIDNNDVTGLSGAMQTTSGTGIRVLSISNPGGAVVTNNDVSGFNTGIQLWNDENVVIQGGTVSGNNVGIAALDDHPGFGQDSPDADGDYGIDGVTLTGNGTDLLVQDVELSIDDTTGTSTVSTVQVQGEGEFDEGSYAGALVVSEDIVAVAGNQTVNGGDGVDTYSMVNAGSNGSLVDLDSGLAFSTATGIDNISGIENVRGSAGNDGLYGDDNANTFYATAGADVIDGRGGSDTFDASTAGADDDLTVDLNGGATTGLFTATLSNIENVKTGAGDDTITLSSAANNVNAGFGFDTAVSTDDYADVSGSISYSEANGFQVGADTLKNVEKLDLADKDVWLVHNTAELTYALANAANNDVIKLADGTYSGTFNITQDGLTIESASGNPASVTIQGSMNQDIPAFLKAGGSSSGPTGLSVQGDDITIKGITISGYRKGIDLQTNDGLTIDNVVLDNNVHSIYMENGDSLVTDFELLNSTIKNAYHGLIIEQGTGTAGIGTFDDVTINNVHFEDIVEKGIYATQLSNAEISDIWMDNVGQYGRAPAFGGNGTFGAGIDLNLKFGTYTNISIHDFHFTDVGASNRDGAAASHDGGGAIQVKARDDSGGSVTVTGVTIEDGDITGTSTGIRVGEPNKTNVGPTGITVENVDISGAVSGTYDNRTQTPLNVTLSNDAETVTTNANATGAFNIDAGGGNDTVTTGAANDTIEGGAGTDSLDGAGGTADVALFDSNYSDAKINGTAASFTVDVDGALVTEGADTLLNIEKAVFTNGASADTTVWLVNSSTELTAALAGAVDGDVIYLAAGTYAGNFTLANKAVTITSNNALEAGTSGGRTAEAIIDGKFLVDNTGGGVAKNVTIEGVRFLNSSALNGDGALRFKGPGDFVVKNSIFYSTDADSGTSTPTFVASHVNRAILLDTTLTGNVTVQNNLFSGSHTGAFATASWTTAIWHDGTAALNATGNTINYSRTGFNLDGFDNNGSISGNTFDVVGTAMSFGLAVVGLSAIQNNIFGDTGTDWNIRNATTGVDLDLLNSNNLSSSGTPNTTTGGGINLVYGTLQSDTISGSNGVDAVFGDGLATVTAGSNDVITLRGGNDSASGQGGNDTIDGGSGDDSIDGGAGDDSIAGGADNDGLSGGTGNDSINGDGGNDTMVGGDNNDTVNGGSGTDNISGDAGADVLDGGDDADTVSGGDGNDTITGGSGGDSLLGGNNDDNITGGDGNDTIDAGGGTDTVVFEHAFGEYDIDYNSGTGVYALTRNGVVDTVKNVEVFKFLDETIDVSLDPNAVINQFDPVITGASVVSLAEGAVGEVYDTSATDADAEDPFGAIVYSLEGVDEDFFTIDEDTGEIFLTAPADYEDKTSYSVTVRATQGSTTSTKALTFNVTDSNDTNPSFSSAASVAVNENTLTSVVIHTAAASDPDTVGGALLYSLQSGDFAAFTINPTTGQLTFNSSPDFETKTKYTFQIVATQGVTSTAQNFTVNINNVVENALALSVLEATLESGTTKTALPNVTGATDDHTFEVLSLDLDGGKLYLANGTTEVAVGQTLSLAQVNGLLLSSGAAGTSSIQFEVHLDGAEDDTLNYAITVDPKVNGLYEGGGGANRLDGASGHDTIKGYGGNDTLFGGAHNDSILGSTGNDELHGGTGRDTLDGGTGVDKFVFDTALATKNADKIVGFTHLTDKIVLSASIFTAIGPTFIANEFKANTTGNADGNDHIIYETDTGKLFYDADSNGAGAKVLIATLDNKATLTFDDFIYIA